MIRLFGMLIAAAFLAAACGSSGTSKSDYAKSLNQAEEQTSHADIGYHYVAVDNNGNPLETLTNNAPDYLVDANGDGLPDWWELAHGLDPKNPADAAAGQGRAWRCCCENQCQRRGAGQNSRIHHLILHHRVTVLTPGALSRSG